MSDCQTTIVQRWMESCSFRDGSLWCSSTCHPGEPGCPEPVSHPAAASVQALGKRSAPSASWPAVACLCVLPVDPAGQEDYILMMPDQLLPLSCLPNRRLASCRTELSASAPMRMPVSKHLNLKADAIMVLQSLRVWLHIPLS